MTTDLAARQTVPLAPADRQALHQAAVSLGVSPGLLARGLILAGLERISEPDVLAHITAESAAAKLRASNAGKTAMKARYGSTSTTRSTTTRDNVEVSDQ